MHPNEKRLAPTLAHLSRLESCPELPVADEAEDEPVALAYEQSWHKLTPFLDGATPDEFVDTPEVPAILMHTPQTEFILIDKDGAALDRADSFNTLPDRSKNPGLQISVNCNY